MAGYQAPLRDMHFVLHEVQRAASLCLVMPATAELTTDLMDAVLESAAQLATEVLAPINRSGDEEGCRFEGGRVLTPAGFQQAYKAFADGGWVGLCGDPAFGGQGMPKMLAVLVEEMLMGANTSFALYPILSAGASLALARHASAELKALYLPRLYSGEWTGTMCLTEAHAGTDLGLLKTRAVPVEDGTYLITGSKIFITGGEHDLSSNIIHLVLARLPDAPAGPKGISLFLVPRHLPDAADQRNGVSCGAIEHKMGIKASATCVINFDGARGFLVGEPNKGLACMFTMMNYERLSIGLQGLGLAEHSLQTASAYARERLQGRATQAPANPMGPADSILVHPDVRRMLLGIRAELEAGRALAVYVASQLDMAHFHQDARVRERAARLVALLTPVAKAAFSDRGFEGCVQAQQVLGGHGYVREWGLEQNVRDARIAQIYEGTNGIQALDLAGRKVTRDQEGLLATLYEELEVFMDTVGGDSVMQEFLSPLQKNLKEFRSVTAWLQQAAATDPDETGAASVPYLRLLSQLLYCFMWCRMVVAARDGLARATGDRQFYEDKLAIARFFMVRMMPAALALSAEIKGGCATVMALPADRF